MKAVGRRPGLDISRQARRLGPRWAKTNRTQHSFGLRRLDLARSSGCARDVALAGPDTYGFPVSRPVKSGGPSSRKRTPVGLGLAAGAGRRAIPPSFTAATRRGSGGLWDGSMPSPFSWDSFALIPYVPRPALAPRPIRRGTKGRNGRRPFQAAGCRGCGLGQACADSKSSDNALSS